MAEALKTLDVGLAAAETELAACCADLASQGAADGARQQSSDEAEPAPVTVAAASASSSTAEGCREFCARLQTFVVGFGCCLP